MGTLFAPGPLWILIGGAAACTGWVMLCRAVGRYLNWSGGRAHAEAVAEVTPAPGPQRWHPSQGPRREPVTELFARCVDEPDATVLIPRPRGVSR